MARQNGDATKYQILLQNPEKAYQEATGVLSKIFVKLLVGEKVGVPQWNKKMDDYLNDPTNRIPKHPKGRQSARGNLSKELLKRNMTWKNFIKGILWLGPVKFKIRLEFEWPSRNKSSYNFVVYDKTKGVTMNMEDLNSDAKEEDSSEAQIKRSRVKTLSTDELKKALKSM
ncbi:MAG: hypothetical protein IBX57_01085 [Gammaproteobacteria bacterium]|nr:hypothetical protein [Gammaproteobacteria bacterium]